MDDIKRHLSLFPERLRRALEAFHHWESICEIRLRDSLPLSLTSFHGNILLDENGSPCAMEQAITCQADELRSVLGAFCGGSVYRYFDRLKDGFAVDEYGWRMGICPQKGSLGNFLPERLQGINLRIPRMIRGAAEPIVTKFSQEGVSSLLVLSRPGDGKTTLLRDLAIALSRGEGIEKPLRVAVVDERRELFPAVFQRDNGLLDILAGYEKKEGIEIAARLFSPQVILCDEIGSREEAAALLSSCSGGCRVIASAHAASLAEAKRLFYLAPLLESGMFQSTASIQKLPGKTYQSQILWEKVS